MGNRPSEGCPSVVLSWWGVALVGNHPSGSCPGGELSGWELSGGELSSGELS